MTQLAEYPLFSPPEHLVEKGRENWTVDDAAAYRDWLIEVQDARVDALANVLGISSSSPISDRLMGAGEKVAAILKDAPFSGDSSAGRTLTNHGYAIAADMGLLVAKCLLESLQGKLRWEVMRKSKSELAYNVPVLVGFSSNYLDPVGGSTAEALAILRGLRGADAWRRIYEYWVAKA